MSRNPIGTSAIVAVHRKCFGRAMVQGMQPKQIKKEHRPMAMRCSGQSVEDWVDLEYINEVIKTLGGRGHTRSLRMNYIIISLSKITGAISNLLDVLIIVRPVKEKMDLIQSSAFDESMGSLDHLGISSSWNSY